MPNWKDYQEEAAGFFRSLGLDAKTDVTIQGVRTTHDVDVLVKSRQYGFDITWIVECKQWSSPISKLHVLALRNIVADTGADRGILLAENGFQSGAVEAANLTNVWVTSLAEFSIVARERISAVRVRELFDRLENCHKRYWEIPKAKRIADGLRPDFGAVGYTGTVIIDACRDILSRASIGNFPFRSTSVAESFLPALQQDFASTSQVVEVANELVTELEEKLQASENKKP